MAVMLEKQVRTTPPVVKPACDATPNGKDKP